MTMDGRVAILRAGEPQQIGSSDEVYAHPVNALVAGFIGSPAMNLLSGRFERGGGRCLVTFGGSPLLVPPPVLARRPRLASAAGR
jgi:multiple sugar transport system ATP-binding protein